MRVSYACLVTGSAALPAARIFRLRELPGIRFTDNLIPGIHFRKGKKKMKKTAKIISLILASLMLLLAAASCAEEKKPEDTLPVADTTAETPESTADGRYDEEGYLKDSLDEKYELGGEISLLYWSDVENPEFEILESNGDLVDEALFARDSRVQDRLGVEIVYSSTPGNVNNVTNYTNYVQNAYKTGEPLDICAAYSMTIANISTLGLCSNLLEESVIDFEKPWWPDDLVNETTINGKLFFASGDISTNLLYMMYTVYFNKEIISEYKLDNPYTLIANNEWTFDKFYEMGMAVGDSVTPGADNAVYGMSLLSNVHTDPFFYGAGLRTVSKGTDGVPVLAESFGSETADRIVEAANGFLTSQATVISSSPDYFAVGKSLFTMHRSVYAKTKLVSTDLDFGIAVTPKDGKDQESYATCLAFPVSLYAISSGSERKSDAALLLEAMASEGYRTVTPQLFEVSLKVKYANDSETAQMFDLIRDTVVFDLGRLYTTALNKRTYQLFRNAMNAATYTSYQVQYNGEKKVLQKNLDKLIECFN